MDRKQAEERSFRDSGGTTTRSSRTPIGDAWDDVAAALDGLGRRSTTTTTCSRARPAFNSELFGIARTLVRLADETAKPNADRLREYRESNLDSLKQQLFSEAPIYDDLETVKLADSLSMLLEMAGRGRPAGAEGAGRQVARASGAAELIAGTKLADVAVRKQLAEGGAKAIEASRRSDDPAGPAGRRPGPQAPQDLRGARSRSRSARPTPRSPTPASPSTAPSAYPDATFTLRLAFGTVKGYDGGRQADARPGPPSAAPIEHAARTRQQRTRSTCPSAGSKHKDQLDLDTPFNFVSTADIIGGNSGSPVVNRDGEVVGIIFDGNIQSLVLGLRLHRRAGPRRSPSTRPAILEALRKVYDAGRLADELSPGAPKGRSSSNP